MADDVWTALLITSPAVKKPPFRAESETGSPETQI